jgi:HSP20 family molecular chaperone IbpA
MSTLSLWTRRDPFAEFDALIRNAFGQVQTRPSGFTPAAEVTSDGADAVVRVELPGLDVSKDVTVEVEDGRLVVRGERRDEDTEQRDGHSLREVRYGSFRRTFALPKHVSSEAISASYDAGVLSVRVAGAYAESDGTKRIEITAGSDEAPATES